MKVHQTVTQRWGVLQNTLSCILVVELNHFFKIDNMTEDGWMGEGQIPPSADIDGHLVCAGGPVLVLGSRDK